MLISTKSNVTECGARLFLSPEKANNIGRVAAEIDLLIDRVADRIPERLQEEADLGSRAMLFGLLAQLSAIRRPVVDLLEHIFEPNRYQMTTTLRGFYFTSGTQTGTPFDLIGPAPQKSHTLEIVGASTSAGPHKSYFLHDLFAKVVSGDAGSSSAQRAFAARVTAFTLIGLAIVGALSLWWIELHPRHRADPGYGNRHRRLCRGGWKPLIRQDT